MRTILTTPVYILFFGLMSLFMTNCLQAQVNTSGVASMKVGQLSDQQLLQYWQQAQRSGVSEKDAINLLIKRGMSPADVNLFKQRLLQLQSVSPGKNGLSAKPLIKDTANFLRDSSWVTELPLLQRRSRYYGFDFFNNPNPVFQPNSLIATPQNYVLGPGDGLSINITGANEKSQNATVTPEGNIQLDYAGIVPVNGLTIEEATQKIRARLKSVYPALQSGGTRLSVTLSDIRSIRVSVIGEAERAGDYVVSSLAGFFNVLYLSGGPSQNGSLRKIELIRNNKHIETIDFYAFLQKGIMDKNIRLQDQDVIRFPYYEKRVILSGEVRKPAIYELLDKETLADLLQYGGGTTETAIKDAAKLVQMDVRDLRVRDVDLIDFPYFIPRNGDSVFFDKILPRYANRVALSGAVYRPGNYELTNGLTLGQLIKKADGLREEAFLNRGYIKRLIQGTDKEMLSFDAGRILSGAASDIILQREDSVFIPGRDSLQDHPIVTIGGAVHNPGVFAYRKGMLLEDLVLLANGFSADAANHKVELSRLDKNRADTLANRLLTVEVLDVDSSLLSSGGAAKTLLQPMDYVYVPQLLNYRNLGTVKLRGEVLYAGDYALEKRNETVQEVIARAGGISPNATMHDVQVYRNGLRVATTLLSEGSHNTRFLLQPDDSIFIPRTEPFVELKGAVFNPQIVSYGSTSFMSYISDAGGVTDKGNLRKAYVQYSNGINRKIHHFLFFRNYPRVLPGSKIIVPEKIEGERHGLSIIEISALTGSFTALISLISVLRK